MGCCINGSICNNRIISVLNGYARFFPPWSILKSVDRSVFGPALLVFIFVPNMKNFDILNRPSAIFHSVLSGIFLFFNCKEVYL